MNNKKHEYYGIKYCDHTGKIYYYIGCDCVSFASYEDMLEMYVKPLKFATKEQAQSYITMHLARTMACPIEYFSVIKVIERPIEITELRAG